MKYQIVCIINIRYEPTWHKWIEIKKKWRFNGKMSAFRFGGLILCLVINNEPFKFIVPESLCVTGMTLCAHLSHFSIFIYGNWNYLLNRLTQHRLMKFCLIKSFTFGLRWFYSFALRYNQIRWKALRSTNRYITSKNLPKNIILKISILLWN